MARKPRVTAMDGIHHIMSRGGDNNKNRSLFKSSEDKEEFLKMVKDVKDKFKFRVISFCLMDSHYHLLIDVNGGNISKMMQSVNQRYAQYHNKKYNKRGFVFADRFKNVIETKDAQLIQTIRYIHNNTKDLKRYANRADEYTYSSFGIYMGRFEDKHKLVDKDFALSLFDGENKVLEMYKDFMQYSKKLDYMEFTEEKEKHFDKFNKQEYNPETELMKRDIKYEYIVEKIKELLEIKTEGAELYKYDRKYTKLRGLITYCASVFGDYCIANIAERLGNITVSNARWLSYKGKEFFHENEDYMKMIVLT